MQDVYARLENGLVVEYPLSQFDIASRYPNTSFTFGDLFLCPIGYVKVTIVDKPLITWSQTIEEVLPVFVGEVLTQTYLITDLTETEKEEYINDLKFQKRQEINSCRLSANYTSFVYQGKEIATDLLSRSDIDGTNAAIINSGQMPVPWVGGWKTTDNSIIPISTVEEWKAFYKAMYDRGIANFIKSQTLKAQLDSPLCNTPELINAIVWDEPESLPE